MAEPGETSPGQRLKGGDRRARRSEHGNKQLGLIATFLVQYALLFVVLLVGATALIIIGTLVLGIFE